MGRNTQKYYYLLFFVFVRSSHALNSIRNQTIKFYGVVFIIKFISGFFLSIFPPLSGKIALTLPRLCASICECLLPTE